MSKISFVYFDVGGVFFDWKNVFATPAKDFGISIQDIDDMFTKYDEKITKGVISPKDFWQLCRKELNIKEGVNYNFLEAWISDYIPNKFIYDLAISLHDKCQLGLISNIYQGMYPVLVDKGVIPRGIFSETILSCDIHMRKPDKAIYDLAQQKAGVLPKEIFYIDDSESYLAISKELGWQTFHYNTQDCSRSNAELSIALRSCLPR